MNPIATIEMENGAIMRAELLVDMAPNTVANFISLANSGFYDGLIFHRIVSGFVIQGGDPNGIGTGGPGYSIKGEFRMNGFAANTLSHDKGVLSMARAQNPNSAGSQFFICLEDAKFLDGQYAGFGRLLDAESQKVCDEIGAVRTDFRDKPLEDQRMKSVRVDLNGAEVPELIKL